MSAAVELFQRLCESRPEELASAWVESGDTDAVKLAEQLDPGSLGAVLAQLPAWRLASILPLLGEKRLADSIEYRPLDEAIYLVRNLEGKLRDAVLNKLPQGLARRLDQISRTEKNSAASNAYKYALTAQGQSTVKDIQEKIRRHPHRVQSYIYLLGEDQVLLGAISLKALLKADPASSAAKLAVEDCEVILGSLDMAHTQNHPAWARFRCLPVVDAELRFLGTLSRKDITAQSAQSTAASEAALALGESFLIGFRGLGEALAGFLGRRP